MTNQNTSTNQNTETEYEYKRIASMDLIDFSQQLQDCIKHGYDLVLDNENSPVQLGTLLTCGVRRLVYVAEEEERKVVPSIGSKMEDAVQQPSKLEITKHRRSAKTADKILT